MAAGGIQNFIDLLRFRPRYFAGISLSACRQILRVREDCTTEGKTEKSEEARGWWQ